MMKPIEGRSVRKEPWTEVEPKSTVEMKNIQKSVVQKAKWDNDGNITLTDIVNPLGLKWKPSLISVVGYILCWPVLLAFYFFPKGDGCHCLPVSNITIVTLWFGLSFSFQRFIAYLANGMLNPVWKVVSEHHRKKIVDRLFDLMLRMIQFGLCSWIFKFSEHSLLKATVSLDRENCPPRTVTFFIMLHFFYAQMIYDIFTKNLNKGKAFHHAAVIISSILLLEPSITSDVSSVYYMSTLASIVLGSQCVAFHYPAYILYHLYPNSPTYQFASLVWILVIKIIIVTVFFISIPIYIIWSNFNKMSDVTFWILFLIVSVHIVGELVILSIQMSVCRKKYITWKIESHECRARFGFRARFGNIRELGRIWDQN